MRALISTPTGTPLFAGGVAGGPGGVGFPIRRHSSAAFAANRRYSSNALLSPSTAAQVREKKRAIGVSRRRTRFKTVFFIGIFLAKESKGLCCCFCMAMLPCFKNSTYQQNTLKFPLQKHGPFFPSG